MQVHDGPYNPELTKMLYEFSDWFYTIERSKIPLRGSTDVNEEFTTDSWLEERKKVPINTEEGVGFPTKVYGTDLVMSLAPQEYMKKFNEINKDLNHWFGSKYCAVQMYYPEGGYMDWHNNGNAAGYNILLSYSRNGNGWFKYQDPISKEIITLKDKPGWNIKTGYYGRHDEQDKLIWHCARTYDSYRITFGYVIPDENMWEMMIEDILNAE